MKEIKDNECISKKISVLANEHPDWKHDKKVAVAHAYCGLSKKADAIELSSVIKRSKSLSLSRFSTLIKAIKTRAGLKVGHAGILPQKISLPMKNLNRLQTKMEKQVTEESKWLTAEQYEQRKQYAKYMRKEDADFYTILRETLPPIMDDDFLGERPPIITEQEYVDTLGGLYLEILEYFPNLPPEEAIDRAFEPPEGDNAWIMSDESEIISMNDGLNNIIKAPIILAKEMIQRYTNEKGEVEYHFKPYEELKYAVDTAKLNGSVDIIIEHQDKYNYKDIIGSVKEFRADDSTRSIRGIGYFNETKLPDGLKQMIKDGETIAVSIGFLAILGDGGTWNGIDYKHTQTNIILRHLAVCLESVPRCPIGVCGINLEDAEKTEKKTFIIINKDNYYYNICKIFNDSDDDLNIESKKETNKEINLENKEKIETMQNDLKEEDSLNKNQADDFNVILSKLQKHIQNEPLDLKEQIIAKILAALGIKTKSDSEMDEKEFQDAIQLKDSEIEELVKELKDARNSIFEFEEKEKLNYIKVIKKFGDKYSDEELAKEDLKSLEKIADAVSRFAPSNKEPDVLPTGNVTDKKKLEDELDLGERTDPFSIFEDVNKEFNMSGL